VIDKRLYEPRRIQRKRRVSSLIFIMTVICFFCLSRKGACVEVVFWCFLRKSQKSGFLPVFFTFLDPKKNPKVGRPKPLFFSLFFGPKKNTGGFELFVKNVGHDPRFLGFLPKKWQKKGFFVVFWQKIGFLWFFVRFC